MCLCSVAGAFSKNSHRDLNPRPIHLCIRRRFYLQRLAQQSRTGVCPHLRFRERLPSYAALVCRPPVGPLHVEQGPRSGQRGHTVPYSPGRSVWNRSSSCCVYVPKVHRFSLHAGSLSLIKWSRITVLM